jgi:hypothetical protein
MCRDVFAECALERSARREIRKMLRAASSASRMCWVRARTTPKETRRCTVTMGRPRQRKARTVAAAEGGTRAKAGESERRMKGGSGNRVEVDEEEEEAAGVGEEGDGEA